jgi:hypothetical protein
MDGENVVKLIELRSAAGLLLAVIQIKEMAASGKEQASEVAKGEEFPWDEKPKEENPFMTDAQKRYLFRLLAEQGIENSSAHEHLKRKFKVGSLKEVTKAAASKEIEYLLALMKGGGNHAH